MKKKCVYCLDCLGNLTVDHVFPKSWYLNSVPKNTKKWTVPSCIKCNNYYSKIEEDLFTRLGLCLKINNIDENTVKQKILRSIQPGQGKNSKDVLSRQNKREKILKQMTRINELPSYGILPGFGPKTNIILPEYSTIKIDPKLIELFGVKLTKGFTYIFYNIFIDGEDKIDILLPTNNNIRFVNHLFQKYGIKYDNIGNSIIIERVKAEEDKKISILYHFNIWNSLNLYSHILKIK